MTRLTRRGNAMANLFWLMKPSAEGKPSAYISPRLPLSRNGIGLDLIA
jgi:hypothetical protein